VSTLSRYIVEDADGQERNVYDAYDYFNAAAEAERIGGRVIEYEYEFSAARAVLDFTASPVAGFER